MTSLDMLVNDPKHAQLIAEVLADSASNGAYSHRSAYQVLRSITPEQLHILYNTFCTYGPRVFRQQFGPVYHEARGDNDGDLFRDVDGEL